MIHFDTSTLRQAQCIAQLSASHSSVQAEKIVFSNQKGGVGKTTLTRELGIYLASLGKSVLAIDLDPQANLTRSLTDDPSTSSSTGSSHRLSLLAGDIKEWKALLMNPVQKQGR